jgi:hypothetical protein
MTVELAVVRPVASGNENPELGEPLFRISATAGFVSSSPRLLPLDLN